MIIRRIPTTEEIDAGWVLPAEDLGFSPFFTAAYLAQAGEPPLPASAFPKAWAMPPLRRRSGYAAGGA